MPFKGEGLEENAIKWGDSKVRFIPKDLEQKVSGQNSRGWEPSKYISLSPPPPPLTLYLISVPPANS